MYPENDDICLFINNESEIISSLNDSSVLTNLRARFERKIFYTYVSKVLIAMNPYEACRNSYGPEQIERYKRKPSGYLPPHIYAMASGALKDMVSSQLNQSLIITGVSGSGKTETAKHAIDYLCCGTDCQAINNSNPILEAFGNSRTRLNTNSSRFCSFIEILYNSDMKQSGAKVSYHLLETNRICSVNSPFDSNFHIFYKLLFGATNDVLANIHLDRSKKYDYLPDIDFVEGYNDNTSFGRELHLVNTKLDLFGFTNEEKDLIYKVLSAILNLGNIQFEVRDDISYVSENTLPFLSNVAVLLRINQSELVKVLTSRVIEVSSIIIRCSLTTEVARKTRDSLSKGLYDQLFSYIVKRINGSKSDLSAYSIGILDIAGFEYSTEMDNSFNQLCINYTNERFQQYFTELMLLQEKKWYDSQGLDVPFVPFFNNSCIIDLFHNKSIGLFALLDDECKFQNPSTDNFTKNLKNSWEKETSSPMSWNVSNRKSDVFLIRHFASDVCYSTRDFVEKNSNVIPNAFSLIIQNTFQKPNTVPEIGHKSKTSSSILKSELDILLEKLKKTHSQFVRCIRPNGKKQCGVFDGEEIIHQLHTTCTVSYAKFIRFGFPKSVPLQNFVNMIQPLENILKKMGCTDFCLQTLLSIENEFN